MNSQIKKLPKSMVEIKIEVSVEEIKPFLGQAAKKISQEVKIDGFRPGKASYEAIKQKFGEMAILQEALDSIIAEFYYQSLEKEKIMAIGQPEIKVEKMAPANPLAFTATVSVLPEVKIGDYAKIKISRQAVEVKDAQIDKVLKNIQAMRAKEILVNREAKKGDKAEIDFEIFIDKVAIENGKHQKYPVTIGENRFIEGFEEKIAGMKAGEVKEFELKFPDKYYEKKMAGKKAEFKVKCLAVYKIQLPELNDDFAKEITGGKAKTFVELKTEIKNNLKKEEEMKEEQRLEGEILDKLVGASVFTDELPEQLLEYEIEKMINELEDNISRQGMNINDYLTSIKKSKEDLAKDFRPQAEKRAKTAIIAREVYQEQKIKVSDEELKKEIDILTASYKSIPEAQKQFSSPEYKDYLRNIIGNRKVIEYLKSVMIK